METVTSRVTVAMDVTHPPHRTPENAAAMVLARAKDDLAGQPALGDNVRVDPSTITAWGEAMT